MSPIVESRAASMTEWQASLCLRRKRRQAGEQQPDEGQPEQQRSCKLWPSESLVNHWKQEAWGWDKRAYKKHVYLAQVRCATESRAHGFGRAVGWSTHTIHGVHECDRITCLAD